MTSKNSKSSNRKVEHPLHVALGNALNALTEKIGPSKILRDRVCGGSHNLPLFIGEKRSNASECCNPDFLILQNDEIYVIIEVEEAGIKPTQICGKFLTSVIATHYIHGTEKPLAKSKSTTFVQVVDISRLKHDSNKIKQFEMLKTAICLILPMIKSTGIIQYELFPVKDTTEEKMRKVVTFILDKINAVPVGG